MAGAASGRFTIKVCGKAHAWCSICRPAQAAALRQPKPPRKQYERPCRNCGRCDVCIGQTSPPGLKRCRGCGEEKPLSGFSRRHDTGGYRNHCIRCRNGALKPTRCMRCDRTFVRSNDNRQLCATCRPPLTKQCKVCGKAFVGSMDQRRYCSATCRTNSLTSQRKTTRTVQRLRALEAYSDGSPECACCGEATMGFLSLDHVNGGGHRQRRELGGGGFWTWLAKNNYPPGFRVLCHNCNVGRQINGGICPHEEPA